MKYPFHISEYAHSMGNTAGNLIDYWEAIESTNFFMGGAIWDWVDQSMYYYDKETGERFLAYGGDFGDTPNDGTFVNNGLVFADLKEKPQYWEVKKVYQNVGVKWIDSAEQKIEVFNKHYFISLEDVEIRYSLYEDGVAVPGTTAMVIDAPEIGPRQRVEITLPIDSSTLKKHAEYFVKIQFVQKEATPWAEKGFVQMEEQLLWKEAMGRPSMAEVVEGGVLSWKESDSGVVVTGDSFEVTFDRLGGSIFQLKYGDDVVIREGEGPKLDAWRAPLDNDNWAYQQWFNKGLHHLVHKATSEQISQREDGAIVLAYTVDSQAPNGATLHGGTSGRYVLEEHKDRPFGENDFKFTTQQIWTVYRDGSVELQSIISSNEEQFNLARLGYALQMPSSYSNYSYHGRGPVNNYVDRKTAQNIEVHQSTVADQFVSWPSPQSMSNNEDVRWSALTNAEGNGVVFIAKDRLSTSALPWSELEVTLLLILMSCLQVVVRTCISTLR